MNIIKSISVDKNMCEHIDERRATTEQYNFSAWVQQKYKEEFMNERTKKKILEDIQKLTNELMELMVQ